MSKSKHKVSDSQRWAIWTVYAMKCFWCKQPLEFASCQIDGVVPKTTSKIVLKGLVKDYDLGTGFSLSGYENLVPSCDKCLTERSNAKFRPTLLPGLFKLVRVNTPLVEAKVRQIDGEQIRELLRQLVEKLERGEIAPEVLKEIAEPFLTAVEGRPTAAIEFRLNKSVRLFFNQEGVRMQPLSEIRYEKLVDGLIESSEWTERSAERLKEGPTFGEERKRRTIP